MSSAQDSVRQLARRLFHSGRRVARAGYHSGRRSLRVVGREIERLRRRPNGTQRQAVPKTREDAEQRGAGDLRTQVPKASELKRFQRGYHPLAEISRLDAQLVVAGRAQMRERVFLAEAALKAGALDQALAIAEDMLRHDSKRSRAQRVVVRAGDRAAIARNGWVFGGRGETPYEPDPSAVLSVLSQSLPIRAGGYSTRSHGTLTALARQGWHVEALTRLGFPYDRWSKSDPRVVPEMDVVDGIRYHRALTPGVRTYPDHPLRDHVDQFVPHIIERATAMRASLIHASSYYQSGLAAAEAARHLGLPFIYEIRGLHDIYNVSMFPEYAGSLDAQFLSEIELAVCHQADHVLVITPSLLEELVSRGVQREKMSVLPNGVHTADFVPRSRDAELERELGFAGKTVIGYLGGFVRHEGLELLIEATARLTEERDDIRLLMVGDGERDRSLRDMVVTHHLQRVVTFTGRVPHDDIPRYLSLVDITPFPRLPIPVCELISPMKPFEAMAMEKAVVVSDVAALTDIVHDGETGLAFTKGDTDDLVRALGTLIDDAPLRARLGTAARNWVLSERDWATNAQAADVAYRRVLAQH